MDFSRPYAVISPTLDPGVLAVLAGTTKPLTGREIARLVGRSSHSGVIAALERLVDQGVVEREEAGRAFLFALNRDHLAAPAIEQLADLREEFLRRIHKMVDEWVVKAMHLSLFGSAARGEGGTESDIDLFLVRHRLIERQEPVWREQVDLLAWHVERWTGNPARVVEVEDRKVRSLRKRRPPVVSELLNDAITLVGSDVSTLLGEP